MTNSLDHLKDDDGNSLDHFNDLVEKLEDARREWVLVADRKKCVLIEREKNYCTIL